MLRLYKCPPIYLSPSLKLSQVWVVGQFELD
jgi:hypothetical protein